MSQHYADTKIRQKKSQEGKKPPDQNLSLTQMQKLQIKSNSMTHLDHVRLSWECTCLIFKINVIHCICEVKKGKLYDPINRHREII